MKKISYGHKNPSYRLESQREQKKQNKRKLTHVTLIENWSRYPLKRLCFSEFRRHKCWALSSVVVVDQVRSSTLVKNKQENHEIKKCARALKSATVA